MIEVNLFSNDKQINCKTRKISLPLSSILPLYSEPISSYAHSLPSSFSKLKMMVLGAKFASISIVLSSLFGQGLAVSGQFDSKFLGDVGPPGVFSTRWNDFGLVSEGGRHRIPTKIQLWCSPRGPVSMAPWYSSTNDLSIKGDARHYTWGSNPPHGDYHELVVDHGSEYISEIAYQSCGRVNHQRICLLFIQKWNHVTNRATSIKCGAENQPGKRYIEIHFLTLRRVLTLRRSNRDCEHFRWR